MVHPAEKVGKLALHFARKLSADGAPTIGCNHRVRQQIRARYKEGRKKLEPPITAAEVLLAARDMPAKKAPGPDAIPAEMYKNVLGLGNLLAGMFTHMIEGNQIPREMFSHHIIPFDKTGRVQHYVRVSGQSRD